MRKQFVQKMPMVRQRVGVVPFEELVGPTTPTGGHNTFAWGHPIYIHNYKVILKECVVRTQTTGSVTFSLYKDYSLAVDGIGSGSLVDSVTISGTSGQQTATLNFEMEPSANPYWLGIDYDSHIGLYRETSDRTYPIDSADRNIEILRGYYRDASSTLLRHYFFFNLTFVWYK